MGDKKVFGTHRSSLWAGAGKLVSGGGIVFSLLMYSTLQERLMTVPYKGETFTVSLFLVLCNRVVTCVVALVCLLLTKGDLRPVAPVHKYAAVSLSNVVATTCQYEALKYISFPLQTLAKCGKMVPVMLWGTLILQKTYQPRDYGLAMAVACGCALFLASGNIAASKASKDTSAYGLMLMLTYLSFDGFTSAWQSKLFKGYQMSIYNQIIYVTLCSSALSLLGMLTGGQLPSAVAFVIKHPEALYSMLLLSLAATAGQLFINHTIRSYGALFFATVMTTRQFLSILLSCILYQHPLTTSQWIATCTVFGSLYLKTLLPKSEQASKHAVPRGSNL